jgi:hypothetical protein
VIPAIFLVVDNAVILRFIIEIVSTRCASRRVKWEGDQGNFAGRCPVSKADLRVQREVLS